MKPLKQLVPIPATANERSSQFWDLYRDGVSPSSLVSFNSDRHTFWLRKVCGIHSVSYNYAQAFGSMLHDVHAAWVSMPNPDDFKINDHLDEYRERWMKEFTESGGILTANDVYHQDVGQAIIKAYWPIYKRKYRCDLQYEWLYVEDFLQAFAELDDSLVPLRGIMDGVPITSKGARVYDMKSMGKINIPQIRRRLWFDVQAQCYLWIQHELGNNPTGLIWDIVRRPRNMPLKSQNQSLHDFKISIRDKVLKDPNYYMTRIHLDVPKAWTYSYYRRILKPMLMEMKDWADGKLRHYMNPTILSGRTFAVDTAEYIMTGTTMGLRQQKVDDD